MDWKQKAKILAVLYRIGECKQQFSVNPETDDENFVAEDLRQLFTHSMIEIDSNTLCYKLGAKGQKFLGSIVDMVNKLLPYEIFSAVTVERELTVDERDDANPMLPASNVFDPRFKPNPAATDMRLAIVTWLNETAQGEQIDPHFVVFIQKLGSGQFKTDNFWFELKSGEVFAYIEKIVASAYKWRDASGEEADAANVMQAVYAAGMLEMQKREGSVCGGCGTPLAIYEDYARAEGKTLDDCPNPDCNTSFVARTTGGTTTAGYSCPACGADITSRQRRCHGCHAVIDRSLPSGSIETVTTETLVEDVYYTTDYYGPCWSYDYGYYGVAPVYYYDPYDPLIAATALTCLAIALW